MGAVADEDVICLSSDTDDEGVSNAGVKEISKKKPASTVISLPGISIIGNVSKNFSSSPRGVKAENGSLKRRITPEQVDLDDDDFEIEYQKDSEQGVWGERGEVHEVSDSDSDDDVQVLSAPQVEPSGSRNIPGLEVIGKQTESEEDSSVKENQSGNGSVVNHIGEGDGEESKKLHTITTKSWLQRFLHALRKVNRAPTFKQLLKIDKKIWKGYAQVENLGVSVQLHVQQEIRESTLALRETPERLWSIVKDVLSVLDPENAVKTEKVNPQQREEQRALEKRKAAEKYEKQLLKLQQRIRELEEEDVDWDSEEEHNSAYILMQKFRKKMMELFYKLCDLSHANRFTDRPIQKKINLEKCKAGSGYKEIDEEIEKFVNKKGFLFIPDFNDIKDIVEKVNNQSKCLGLGQDPFKVAQEVFTKVFAIIKKRREKDFHSCMAELSRPKSSNVDLEDPSEADAELRQKLAENDKVKKTEREVIEHYSRISEEQGKQAKVVTDEDASNSPPPSDNEEEDDIDDEDGGSGDEEVDEENLEAAQHDELLSDDEDDDLVPESSCEVESVDCNSNETQGKGDADIADEIAGRVNDVERSEDGEPPLKKMRPCEDTNAIILSECPEVSA